MLVTLKNGGGTAARGFRVCAVMSTDPAPTTSNGTLLAKSGTVTLLDAATETVRMEPVIPAAAAAGSYYLAAIADCDQQVQDTDRSNNTVVRSTQILVRDPAPNFQPFAVLTPTVAAAGEMLAVTLGIGNYGSAAGSAPVRLAIGKSQVRDPSDADIWDSPTPIMLAPAQETSLSMWAPVPPELESGVYYLLAIVDPDQTTTEIDRSNEVLASQPIMVVGGDLAIVSPNPPAATIGVAYDWRFRAVGGLGPDTFSISWNGAPPSGLAFDPTQGELSGTPGADAIGPHDFSVTVTSSGAVGKRDYRLLVLPPGVPLQIVSGRLPPALLQAHYTVKVIAVGGTPPYVFSKTSGALPRNFRLLPDGTIDGFAASGVGPYILTVTATDANGAMASGAIAFNVIDPAATVTISTADIPSGVVGISYQYGFETSGGTAPLTWSESGTLPGGITFDPTMAQLTGTPTVAGSFPMIIGVHDSAGLFDRDAYVLQIFPLGNLLITTTADKLPHGEVGKPYVASGGGAVKIQVVPRTASTAISRLSYMIVLGGLPDGLALDSNAGTVSGTPTKAGVFPFSLLVVDPTGDSQRTTLAIVVDPAGGVVMPKTSTGCGCKEVSDPGPEGMLLLLAALAVLRRSRARAR
jgi:hypothetical protein